MGDCHASSLEPRRHLAADPLVSEQWHLAPPTPGEAGANVLAAHAMPSPTDAAVDGSGVLVAIVDNGVRLDHYDLDDNLIADYGYDFADDDPLPLASGSVPQSSPWWGHGTAVAGIVAAEAGNGRGGQGVAPDASLAALRLFAGASPPTDDAAAAALAWRADEVDVYVNAWGPADDGERFEGPAPATAAVIEQTATTGRGGLGSVLVWAAGNGGSDDDANRDGYANSRHTIAVTAVSEQGVRPFYAETGANLLVAAPSSGQTGTDRAIVTASPLLAEASASSVPPLAEGVPAAAELVPRSIALEPLASSTGYRDDFGGTSAAAPVVAGVVALMLEANPDLSARDVQHVLVDSAVQNDATSGTWQINAAGRTVSHVYGHGLVDAAAAVTLAQDWQTVGSEQSVATPTVSVATPIPADGSTLSVPLSLPAGIRIEHVELDLDASHTFRGDIEAVLRSPNGTESRLLVANDDPNEDIRDWTLTSTQHWGESSGGVWTLNVRDAFPASDNGVLNNVQLRAFGTVVPQPAVQAFGPSSRASPARIWTGQAETFAAEAMNGSGVRHVSVITVFVDRRLGPMLLVM